mmetsp:Transcript_16807/g.37948  ORF Transcript_16807/g.37948 Transcript_16807/m.37948 type:complete len:275 (-) Transcript_16807:301-1125(-)
MDAPPRVAAWVSGPPAPPGARQPARMPSSSSSTSVPAAGPSGQSSISTGMASSSRRPRAWCAASATSPSWWSPSRRWSTSARPASAGRRHGFQVGQFHSICTTSPLSTATAAFGARSPSAGSWTSHVADAGRTRRSFMTSGQRTATRSGPIAGTARSISGPLPGCPRSRVLRRTLTWSTHVITASGRGPSMPRSCCAQRALCAAPSATGSGIQRCSPRGTPRRASRAAVPRRSPKTRPPSRQRRPSDVIMKSLRSRSLWVCSRGHSAGVQACPP